MASSGSKDGFAGYAPTGAQWSELPDRYPPYQTCHRRFQQWRRASVIDRLLGALTRDLEAQSKDQGLHLAATRR